MNQLLISGIIMQKLLGGNIGFLIIDIMYDVIFMFFSFGLNENWAVIKPDFSWQSEQTETRNFLF